MARKATGAIALLIELLWERIGDGCHLSRDIGQLIEESGFRIERMDNGYMPGPRHDVHVRGLRRLCIGTKR
jgi:hypothetical protein